MEALFFDFDGVIADTEPLHFALFAEVAGRYGRACSWEDYQSKYIGYDDRDLFRNFFVDGGMSIDEEFLRHCIHEKSVAFARTVEAHGVEPFPGVVPLIREAARNGLPLALCSGALKSDILPVLRAFGVLDLFQAISTAEDVPRSKPDPAPYLHAYDELCRAIGRALDKNRCVVFEDTPSGAQSARTAGLFVVGVEREPQSALAANVQARIAGFDRLNLDALEKIICQRGER